jgi:hypothetical protein
MVLFVVMRKDRRHVPEICSSNAFTPSYPSDFVLQSVDRLPVEVGGHFDPSVTCGRTPRSKTAILVPYRDRPDNLKVFLAHMHRFLMKQDIRYTIYIIEQVRVFFHSASVTS